MSRSLSKFSGNFKCSNYQKLYWLLLLVILSFLLAVYPLAIAEEPEEIQQFAVNNVTESTRESNPESTSSGKRLNSTFSTPERDETTVKSTIETTEDLQFPLKGSDDFEALPERPLQLVKPDPVEHKKLVLVDENIRHLHYLKGGVAVVAVVGKFHSGKSFLLNQLMGKHDGFGVGPTVRPQTMGIWMWGKVCCKQA